MEEVLSDCQSNECVSDDKGIVHNGDKDLVDFSNRDNQDSRRICGNDVLYVHGI
jgi:hypothetical protein